MGRDRRSVGDAGPYTVAAIEQANDEVYSIDLNYTITEQHGEMFYDIQEDKYYYRIFTGYEDSNGTCGAVVTMYELRV